MSYKHLNIREREIETQSKKLLTFKSPSRLPYLKRRKKCCRHKLLAKPELFALVKSKSVQLVIQERPSEAKERSRLRRCLFKHYRRIATRYDKLAKRFLAFIHIACILLWLL